ncbi:MAG: threonine synthase [Lentimicrobium sp.]|nr:threonine synthase [Lentimicrobium sp.]
MLYYSTNKRSEPLTFREAAISGQAPDKGLYFPEFIPELSKHFLAELKAKTRAEIAFEVIKPYVGGTIPDEVLHTICEETVNFEFPLVQVNESLYSLELYHGPTLAFKDVGARFMSRCLGYFSRDNKRNVTILVATSGDTGSAVANGFLGVEGVDVVILYPSGKVSNIQELQLTTLGRNITALEVKGTFDDCQTMVKQAFADKELNRKLILTSANSINVARWLPQQFYYFYALQQWPYSQPPVVSVPSGNFGNICAGLLAFKSGLPVQHFIAACNSNDVFPVYLQSGVYNPKPSVSTYSNAMDVGNPSNFVRLTELFEGDLALMQQTVSSCSVSDEVTLETIREVFYNENYLLEPHGAVAYAALKQFMNENPGQRGIFLETAHPVKFNTIVEKCIGKVVDIPVSASHLAGLSKKSLIIEPGFQELKDFLMNK